MSNNGIADLAHLMRRAGFGATRSELEALAEKGYEAVVEELVNPDSVPEFEYDITGRYYGGELHVGPGGWLYRMLNNRRQLQEKMALFWHHVFATGWAKVSHPISLDGQVEMFQRVGMSDLRTILVQLSKDPAMIFWLDNNENVKGEPNENYGRELLELFSMGVGNYTEYDIKMCARAFTGWTFSQPIPLYPHGYHASSFVYKEEEHDDGEKSFLGETGNFNGEDIVDIIVRQPATARFIARHLYNFFVADEPQVPSWNETPPQDPEAIDILVEAYFQSDGNMSDVLRALFNSDFFKEARFKKIKSPIELVTGVIKLVGTHTFPRPGMMNYITQATFMGQRLMDPPTVEGWHTGKEWIDGGTLNQRVNFAVDQVGEASKPGIRQIIDSVGDAESSGELVDRCLDLVGPLTVSGETHDELVEYADAVSDEDRDARVVSMLQQIVATREFQFA